MDKLKEEIRVKLKSIIDPLLTEATAQKQEGGDLVKAKELYMQVLKVDATNRDAVTGLEGIRETLNSRAKRFYAEAILAESMSDLAEAKEKYERCLKTAPDNNNVYRRRCQNKLSRFDGFITGSGRE